MARRTSGRRDRSPSRTSYTAAGTPRPPPAPTCPAGSHRSRGETEAPPAAPSTSPPPSARPCRRSWAHQAPESRRHAAWGSQPPSPAAESKTPNSSDSRPGTDCPSGQPRTHPASAHPPPARPCWPSPAATPPKPSTSGSQTASPSSRARSTSLPPGTKAPVERVNVPGKSAPSLHSHPS
jgi:hypothetical protein